MPELSPRPPTQPAPVERRAWERFTASFPALCRAGRPLGIEYWSAARVRDLSAGGLCLHTHHLFGPGLPLLVLPSGQRFGKPLPPVQVVHVQRDGKVGWLVGGAFTRPLADSELQALL